MKFIKFIFKLTLIFIVVYATINIYNNYKKEETYYPKVQKTSAIINKYYIYGRSLNINGILREKTNDSEIKDISLVLNTKDKDIKIKTSYVIEDNDITFKISDSINDGLVLDDIQIGNYFILLKITYNDKEKSPSYYTLRNNTKYKELDYYTITRNNSNNYVSINFLTRKDIPYTMLGVINKRLPSNVYDIVLDPGHGGVDSGATFNNYEEDKINLSIAKKLKTELERLGLKIKLTRDGNYNPGNYHGIEPYGKGSRVSIPYEVKAKYMFSIHTNSNESDKIKGGLELYLPNLVKFDLARLITSNIIEETNISYSANQAFKEESGIYVRTMSSVDIEQINEDATEHKYEPYNLNLLTPYYYIVRETGGIATHAYVDGRNPKYNKNNYYDSNIGAETYIFELGYINNTNDVIKLTNNQEGYAKGIANAIKQYLFNKK